MARAAHRCTTLIYRGIPGYYLIVCKECGECYGHAESRDRTYLAGLNRNRRPQARKRANKTAYRVRKTGAR
jgi:hypothetical protein